LKGLLLSEGFIKPNEECTLAQLRKRFANMSYGLKHGKEEVIVVEDEEIKEEKENDVGKADGLASGRGLMLKKLLKKLPK
jgi:hypothetical protein